MKVYLAGPMTGLPNFNFPAFDEAAAQLRADGWDVVSPAEMDSDEVREESMGSDGQFINGKVAGETWGDFLSRDVKIVADEVEGVVTLPDWEKSKGAKLEVFVALLQGKPIFRYHEGKVVDLDSSLVMTIIGVEVQYTLGDKPVYDLKEAL